MSEKLPQKEAGLFKKIVRCYECKQYKNGLKFSKTILTNPKFAEHGETLAMKGLILNCMGRKDEAYDCVKKGLRNDLKSHVCWHVFGLLQRSDKKYDEAIRCYRNALKWDKDNIQILRDMSLLQLQMRDLEGFRDTRYQLLKLRPTQRGSWIGYAVSYHLLKDYDMSLKVMAEYRKTQTPNEDKPDFEYSEMILYEVQLYKEAGKVEDSMRHISEFKEHICDDLAMTEYLAELQVLKGNLREAQKYYLELVKRNTENLAYYEALERCCGIDTIEKKIKFYHKLQEKFPRSALLKRIPLSFLTGEQFRKAVTDYLKRALVKGVPSIFVRLKHFYEDKEKAEILSDVILGFEKCLEAERKLTSEDTSVADPSVYLWLNHFLSQHYNRFGNTVTALEYIDKAIDHTPTLPELYMTKAKIIKNGGDLHQACQWMEEAQSLDTADRFVNCKCCKYLLRINEIDRAVELAALFTREGLPPLETLNDMQCNWFETELAKSYFRMGRIGDALKKCHQIDKHFSDIIDDQFDFHSYCMRKMALKSYIRMLHLEDTLRGHALYFACAKVAIEIYLHLYDKPTEIEQENGAKIQDNTMSAAEKKKLKKKQRRAELRAQNKAASHDEKKDQGKGETEQKPNLLSEKNDEFHPQQLAITKQPLEDALKFLKPIQEFSSSRIEVHLLAYKVHSRRGKYLLMLQAIRRALKIDTDHPELHEYVVDFCRKVEQDRGDLPDCTKSVIDLTLPDILGGKSLVDFNEQFLARNSMSYLHAISAGKMRVVLKSHDLDRVVSLLIDLDAYKIGKTPKNAVEVLKLLQSGFFGDVTEVIGDFELKCRNAFPLAVAFNPEGAFVQDQTPNGEPGEDLKENVNPSEF